jgi:hypothetical protein
MERRRSPRVVFKSRAKATSGNTSYNGFIENFSREGMLKIIPNGQVLDIFPGTTLEVCLETPSGEKITLACEIKWVRHSPNMPFGLKHHVGMEIKNTPQKYKDFIHELYAEYLHISTKNA